MKARPSCALHLPGHRWAMVSGSSATCRIKAPGSSPCSKREINAGLATRKPPCREESSTRQGAGGRKDVRLPEASEDTHLEWVGNTYFPRSRATEWPWRDERGPLQLPLQICETLNLERNQLSQEAGGRSRVVSEPSPRMDREASPSEATCP